MCDKCLLRGKEGSNSWCSVYFTKPTFECTKGVKADDVTG